MNAEKKLADALRGIDETCQTGLNSSVYSHWSAALEDSMTQARAALAEYDAQPARDEVYINPAERATILAALRYYQSRGMGDPDNRSDDIHDIATNGGELCASLDDEGIDALCEGLSQ